MIIEIDESKPLKALEDASSVLLLILKALPKEETQRLTDQLFNARARKSTKHRLHLILCAIERIKENRKPTPGEIEEGKTYPFTCTNRPRNRI